MHHEISKIGSFVLKQTLRMTEQERRVIGGDTGGASLLPGDGRLTLTEGALQLYFGKLDSLRIDGLVEVAGEYFLHVNESLINPLRVAYESTKDFINHNLEPYGDY